MCFSIGDLLKIQEHLDQAVLKKFGITKFSLSQKLLDLHIRIGKLAAAWQNRVIMGEGSNARHYYERNKNGWRRYDIILERYTDCFECLLSICLMLEIPCEEIHITQEPAEDIAHQFMDISTCLHPYIVCNEYGWYEIVEQFLILGGMLGFEWEQVSDTYVIKNSSEEDFAQRERGGAE